MDTFCGSALRVEQDLIVQLLPRVDQPVDLVLLPRAQDSQRTGCLKQIDLINDRTESWYQQLGVMQLASAA